MVKLRFTEARLVANLLVIILPLSSRSLSIADDEVFPSGRLNLTTGTLVLGSNPRLEWEIVPSSIAGQVRVETGGRLSLLRDALMSVRVIGVSPGTAPSGEQAPKFEVRMQLNGGGFQPIFFDSRKNGVPGELAHRGMVRSSDRVDFGARIRKSDGRWSGWFSSADSSGRVFALKNGDALPATMASAASRKYLAPYLDGDGLVRTGPNDLLLLIEAGAVDSGGAGFESNDAAMLVSFQGESSN